MQKGMFTSFALYDLYRTNIWLTNNNNGLTLSFIFKWTKNLISFAGLNTI